MRLDSELSGGLCLISLCSVTPALGTCVCICQVSSLCFENEGKTDILFENEERNLSQSTRFSALMFCGFSCCGLYHVYVICLGQLQRGYEVRPEDDCHR